LAKDSALEKWIYREHTRVKHILLEKYLYAWIPILGKWHKRICYFDGFAGRGEYTDGTFGSPIIAMQVANQLIKDCKERNRNQYFDEFVCVNIEKDQENFNNLMEVIKKEKHKYSSQIRVKNKNDEFSNVISETLSEYGCNLAPSFFFIDPFGFSGVPFRIIKDILSIPRTEVFFTFMYREMARFLKNNDLAKIFDELFGISIWREILNQNLQDNQREHALRELYIKQLHDEVKVEYTYPFRICMSEKVQTLYFLIHATNNFKGHSIMKSIMYNLSAKGNFAYLGPKDRSTKQQLSLFNPDDISELQSFLINKFKNQTLTFQQIQIESCKPYYEEPPHIEKHYRKAIKTLEKEGRVSIMRISSKETGLKENDRITFI